jgi:prolipoprotein diacylglyceryl transferase
MGDDIIWSTDPLWFRFGVFSMRYYTALFSAAIVFGYLLWRWQMRRASYPPQATRSLLLLGIPAVIIGARLAHCLLYQPDYYLDNPFQMLRIWRGGFASHGALITLPLVLWYIARRHRLSVIDLMDRFTFSASLGAALVRVGNFFNSEIVGRETDLPFGIRFLRYDAASKLRHPTQLYEAGIGFAVFALLLVVDVRTGRERRPKGLATALFLTVYFGLRFLVEYTKAYQTMNENSPFTLGQLLSIAPVVIGAFLLARVFKECRSA